MHPLDLTLFSTAALQNGTEVAFCINALMPADPGLDMLLGDTFLRVRTTFFVPYPSPCPALFSSPAHPRAPLLFFFSLITSSI